MKTNIIYTILFTFIMSCGSIRLCNEHEVQKRAGEPGECIMTNKSIKKPESVKKPKSVKPKKSSKAIEVINRRSK